MLKKILLPLLLLSTIQQLFPMESIKTEILYCQLFEACKKGNLSFVKDIIEKNQNIDINKQNSTGRTPLLCAAYQGKKDIISYLLQHNANKTIKDNFGQSLFSIMIYTPSWDYQQLHESLKRYTSNEITQECQTIPLPQITFNDQRLKNQIDKHINNVLAEKKSIDSKNKNGHTALELACLYNHIPLTIKFLNRGAFLEKKYSWGESAYENLARYKKNLFVIREAFNNESNVPLVLSKIFNDKDCPLTQNLLPEIIERIKRFYINAIKENFLSTPEAGIWKPVRAHACLLANINATDHDYCLRQILLLPKHKKTELNLLLLEKGL